MMKLARSLGDRAHNRHCSSHQMVLSVETPNTKQVSTARQQSAMSSTMGSSTLSLVWPMGNPGHDTLQLPQTPRRSFSLTSGYASTARQPSATPAATPHTSSLALRRFASTPSLPRMSSTVSEAVEQEELPSVPDVTHLGKSYYVGTSKNKDAFDRFYRDKYWRDPTKEDKFHNIRWDTGRRSHAWQLFSHACNADTGEPAVICILGCAPLAHAAVHGTKAMKHHHKSNEHKKNQGLAVASQRAEASSTLGSQNLTEENHIENFIRKLGRETASVNIPLQLSCRSY